MILKQDGDQKVKFYVMSLFSPHVSPTNNLKNHICSAISEVIRLLENLRLCGNDRNQLDYSMYKLEQLFISVSVVKIYGGIF